MLRRSNLYPKFVLNKCQAISTDTMHRVKFLPGVDFENVLLSYYNSITFAFCEISGRSYGGGVLELLPSEASSIFLPKIDNLDKQIQRKLLKQIELMMMNDQPIEAILDLVDKAILIDFLKVDEETCSSFRVLWKKMQTRRLK